MNKLFTFLASAALISLSACSSDDPAVKGPDGPQDGQGTNMYLQVQILGANTAGRAGEEDSPSTSNPSEGDLVDGDTPEYNVNDAKFYYFNAEGIYMAEATVWSQSGEGSDEKPNVTLESKNILVLRNITNDNLPKYLITVINAPSEFTDNVTANKYKTMDDMRKELVGIFKNDSKNLFVMSTTSFYNGTEGDYDNDHYYANIIKEGQLIEEDPTTADFSKVNVMQIYVERLAAKFTLDVPDSNEFPLEITIGGYTNEGNKTESGHTQVYVRIDKFDVTNVETQSYLSKNIDGFLTTAPWNSTDNPWNEEGKHRSYWGKSINYEKDVELSGPTYNQVYGSIGTDKKAAYSTETTKELDLLKLKEKGSLTNKLNYQKTPNFVIIATVYTKDTDGKTKDLDLIQEGSLYYTPEQYTQFVLSRVDKEGKLNFYKYTGTDTDEEKGKTENYIQVGPSDFKIVRYGTDNSRVQLESTIGAETPLYKKVTDEITKTTSFSQLTAGVASLNTNINSIFKSEKDYPDRKSVV